MISNDNNSPLLRLGSPLTELDSEDDSESSSSPSRQSPTPSTATTTSLGADHPHQLRGRPRHFGGNVSDCRREFNIDKSTARKIKVGSNFRASGVLKKKMNLQASARELLHNPCNWTLELDQSWTCQEGRWKLCNDVGTGVLPFNKTDQG